jgi:hypothetical protein
MTRNSMIYTVHTVLWCSDTVEIVADETNMGDDAEKAKWEFL